MLIDNNDSKLYGYCQKNKNEIDEQMKKLQIERDAVQKKKDEENAKISSIQADIAKQELELNKLRGQTAGNFYELKYYN